MAKQDAIETLKKLSAKSGVPVTVVESKPGTRTAIFLGKKKARAEVSDKPPKKKTAMEAMREPQSGMALPCTSTQRGRAREP